VLGIATLLIALLGDLPDAHATGLIGSGGAGGLQYLQGASSPSAGLYLETLGAVLLLVSGGVGFLMLGPAPGPAEPPEPGPGGPPAPDATPHGLSNSPLSLRDTRRRKWSAS
jgi:hypothetical protein